VDTYLNQTPPDNKKAVFQSMDFSVLPPVTDQWAKLSDAADQEFQKVVLGSETATKALNNLQTKFE
jgi:multiple sugar transport system substrate-binding protein